MRKMLLKGLMVVAAMLVCLSASAIDKVVKSTGLDNEVTSLEELKSKKVILQNADGKMLYIPGVGGETSWDFKMTDLVNGLTSNNGAFLSAIDYDGHLIFQVFNLNGDERATPGWAGGKAYLNTQPAGVNDVIFGLAGMNDQHGQDGPNLAVWDVEYVEGQGFSFHNVGRDIYLGYDATDARPSTSVVYWKAYTAYHASYVPEEVEAAYEQAIAAARTTETIKALETAKAAFDSSADLNAFADAVNAAIDVVNACQAVNAEYANLDEAGAAVAADVLAKYENKEYANIAELRAAYILAAKAQTTAGANMTGAIVNPSFELGTLEGWTSTDGGAIALNYNFAQRTGDKFVERWTPAPGKLSDGSLLQTLTDMPNGKYTLTAEMHNMEQGNNSVPGTGFYLVANDDKTAVAAHGETVTVSTVVTDGKIVIGTKLIVCSGNWICEDNFKLTYLGPVASEEDLAPLTAELANAKLLGVDVSAWEGKTFAASEVSAAIEAVKEAEYKSVLAAYPLNAGSLIPAFDAWEGGMASNKGQHWDGTSTSTYYEQAKDQYGQSSWTNSKTTTVNLPKGKYVIYAAGRNSAGTVCTSYIKVDDQTQIFPAKGDKGYGIATDGTATFDPSATYAFENAGRGWEYRYIAFEVTAEEGESVTLTVGGEATAQYQWMSVCVPVLLATSDNVAIAKQTLAADITAAQAIVDAKAGVGDGLFLIPEEAFSTFSAAVEAAKAVSDNAEATNEEVAAAIAALAAATKTYKETPVNVPAADKQYTLSLKTSDEASPFQLSIVEGKISIEEVGTPITFVAKEGGKFALSNGTESIYYTGANSWSLGATAEEGEAWTITALADGTYTINGKNGSLGTNTKDGFAAGSTCYGNKKTTDGFIAWTISEYVAPAPVLVYTDLAVEDYYTWSAADATGEKVNQCPTTLVLNESTGLPFGDGNVHYLNYVDLSDAVNMVVTATDGTPRMLFNRVEDNGTVNVELPRDAAEYWTEVDNGDGSKTYTVDVKKIVANFGFAHLHCIKGANWANTTVTSVKIGREEKAPVEPELAKVENMTLTVAEDAVIDEDGTFPVVFGYTATVDESLTMPAGSISYTVTAEGKEPINGETDFDVDKDARNIYIAGLEYGTEYTIAINSLSVSYFDLETGESKVVFEQKFEAGELTATFTTNAKPEEPEPIEPDAWYIADKFKVNEYIDGNRIDVATARFVADPTNAENGCIEVITNDNAAETWEAQLFIVSDVEFAAGDVVSLEMKVRADRAQTSGTQLHKNPGEYAHWQAVGDVNFTTEWTAFAGTVTIDASWPTGMKTIAFNLSEVAGQSNRIYFDDVKLTVTKPDGINGVAAGAKANRKVVENGRVVIYKNGVKTMSSGVSIR